MAKFEAWDTQKTCGLALNVEPIYIDCDQIAKMYRRNLPQITPMIRAKIIDSGILIGTGVISIRVDWTEVARTFSDSLEDL